MMKKYVLPTVVSLALSGYALAQESSAPEVTPPAPPAEMTPPAAPAEMTPPAPPAEMTPPAPPAEMTPPVPPAEMTPPVPPMPAAGPDKAYQDMMEKRKQAMEEQKAQRQEVQAFREKMRQANSPEERWRLMDEMRQRQQEMRDKMWKERGMMMQPPHPMGPWNGQNMQSQHYGPRPHYNQPYRGREGMPSGRYGSNQDHRAKMERRLENIENMLIEVIELLQEK